MGGLSITHWLIVLFVVVLLFGARRLPDTARGLARSLRIFRSEIDKDKDPAGPREQQPTQQGDLASWPRLETSGPASDSMPPRSTTPAAAQHDLEVPTSAPVPAEPRIVS